eukprot:tig00021433_g21296.t1
MKLLVAAGNKWYQKCGFDKLDDAYWDEAARTDRRPCRPSRSTQSTLSISKYNKWFLLSDKARALVADIGFFFVQATDYLNLKAYQKSNCAIQSLELDKLEAAGHPVTAAHVMDHLTTAVDDPALP